MKIGISSYPTYGGSGVVAAELGKALASRGHEIHFISTKSPPVFPGFMTGYSFTKWKYQHTRCLNIRPILFRLLLKWLR